MSRRIAAASVLTMVLVAAALAARADVKLPALIGDNMVLQRDAKAAIWGWAEPGEKVTVTVSEQKASGVADAAGKWKVELAPMKAGGPVEITVAGKNTITLKNVLIGDVWLGSGQSNMQMAVGSSNDAAEEIKAADYPQIRLFTVPTVAADTPREDVVGRWVVCDPATVGKFSAVLYFFGRDLHKKLNVPMGLVHSSWGGTPIEAWTARSTYEAEPKLKGILDRWDAELKAAREKAAAVAATRPDAKTPSPAGPNKPTCLYNAMIAPLTPFAIKGAIWYQGEANAGRADLYELQMTAMIRDWRKAWGNEFPFFMVQLANYMARKPDPTDTGWARLREAQLKSWQATPGTGLAVIIDIGNATNIHPKDKQDVGGRLALAARALAYGEKGLTYSGPIYDSMKIEGDKIRLTFKHVGGGLVTRYLPEQSPASQTLPPPGPFAIAGEDHKFVWAEAKIEGNEVVVWSDKVEKPAAVRYGWADNPACNLYNKEALPASPFRTDDWPMGK